MPIAMDEPTNGAAPPSDDGDVMVTVTMPSMQWAMLLGVIEPTVIETGKQLAARKNSLAGLSENQAFILIAPALTRAAIVDAMVAAGEMTPDALAKVGLAVTKKTLGIE